MIQYRKKPVGDDLVVEMTDSTPLLSDPAALRRAFEQDGYVFLRNALGREQVLGARTVVLQRLHEVDEIAAPIIEGVPTGRSRRAERHRDLGAFWKDVSECQAVRDVTHGERLSSVATVLLNGPVVGTDYVILRVAGGGDGTRLHYDLPFFNRYPGPLTTAWIPFGDLEFGQGTLTIVERSQHFDDLIDPIRNVDVSAETGRSVELDGSPQQLVRERGARFLTAAFRAGDVILFSPLMLHGSFDNGATSKGVRLSCDMRFMTADAPRDDRYFGPNPKGITGGGYGELNGAKPLNEAWHVR